MAGSKLNASNGYTKYLNRALDLSLKVSTEGSKKKTAPEPRLIGDNNKTVIVPAGTTVKYSNKWVDAKNQKLNGAASSEYWVSYKDQMYRVHWSYICKPGRETLPSFKPQSLGIKHRYTAAQFSDIIKDMNQGLQRQGSKIGEETLAYIQCLCDCVLGSPSDAAAAKSTIKKNWVVWKDILPLNDISKDLSEILGPLWYITTKKDKYTPVAIEFPAAGNEPLVDYYIEMRENNVSSAPVFKRPCSAKSQMSGKSANTVKLTTVLENVRKNSDRASLMRVWNDHWIWKLIEYNYELVKGRVKVVEANQLLRKWAIDHNIPGASPQKDKSAFWSSVSKHPQNEIDLRAFFQTFAAKNVWYIVFTIDSDGLPRYFADLDLLEAAEVRLKEATEQLGFDVKFKKSKMRA